MSARGAGVVLLLGFLGTIRISPLAGYHAAEHQTVHAIEQGLPLVPECVRHQPRAHPRCGSNLVAFLIITQLTFSLGGPLAELDAPLVLLAALGVAGALYRPFGFSLQQLATTKPPTPRQTASGLAAARALIAAWQRQAPVSAWTRLWRLGFLQVAGGSLITSYGFYLLGF